MAALNKPDVVIICAAEVGGIAANNDFPAEFIYENLMIQSNIVKSSFETDVKLVLLGSSCIYSKYASQPISEDFLLLVSLNQLMNGMVANSWHKIVKPTETNMDVITFLLCLLIFMVLMIILILSLLMLSLH